MRYYHYDSLGSTVALTDAAGVVTGRVQYGTFGAVATSSGDGLNTPWLWHGRHGVWTDKHTGMHQMRARWYSSALRRFLNPDPAGFAGGSNFYLYANGDPVSMIDPFGLGTQHSNASDIPPLGMRLQDLGANVFLAAFGGPGAVSFTSPNSRAAGYSDYTKAVQDEFRPFQDAVMTMGGARIYTPGNVRYSGGSRLPTADLVINNINAQSFGPGQFGRVKESMSNRAAIYQSKITGTLPDVGYIAGGVKFDGFNSYTGVLLDAKGAGYAKFVKNGEFVPWFNGAAGMVEQARNQIGAAGGTPIQWHFAEEAAANATRNLFQSNNIGGISVIHTP